MEALLGSIARASGLQVREGNQQRLLDHVESRVRDMGLVSADAFVRRLAPEHPARAHEMALLADVLTTGETFFMRDGGQMALLASRLLPDLIAARRASGRLELRLWSCACSSGEEAYSLAILLEDLLPDIDQWSIRLIGSDVSREAIARAQRGLYRDWAFRGCSAAFRDRHFLPQGEEWAIRHGLRGRVRFMPLDLLVDPLPDAARGLADMDLIVCRHLFIYLEPEAIARVVAALRDTLADEGLLLTGHGEVREPQALGLQPQLHADSVVYRKAAPMPAPTARVAPAGPAAPMVLAPAVAPSARALATTTATRQAAAVMPDGAALPRATARAATPDAPAVIAGRDGRRWLAQAWQEAESGQAERAQRACAMVLQVDPMLAEAHLLRAILAEDAGDTATAREALRRALYLEPELLAAHVHLEALQRAAGEQPAAARSRATIVRLLRDYAPTDALPHMGGTTAAALASAYDGGGAETALRA